MNNYNWSQRSLEELTDIYHREIAPERRQDGYDPLTDVPSYRWLVDHGYSGLQYAVREHHEMTLTEFFTEIVEITPEPPGETTLTDEWGVNSDGEQAIEYIHQYFESLTRGSAAESTLQSKHSRIRRYVQAYDTLHETAAIVTQISDPDDRPDEIHRVLRVFDLLDEELESNDAKRRYRSDVDAVYDWLVDRGYGAFNPVRYDHTWEVEQKDNQSLTAAQVETLWDTADTIDERLIVLGLCAWGLRRSELAALHEENTRLQAENPFLEFESRKNGPGTVALIYGAEQLRARIAEYADGESWNGYLFVSPTLSCDHITGETVNRRFQTLADTANVSVNGALPTSKMGRRFWYTMYADALETVVSRLDVAADEQGSSDSTVVFSNYLSEEKRREYIRRAMEEKLATVFE